MSALGLILPKLCLRNLGTLIPPPSGPTGEREISMPQTKDREVESRLSNAFLGESMPIDRGFFLRFTVFFIPEGGLINFSFDSQVF